MGCLLAGAHRGHQAQMVEMIGSGESETQVQTILRPIVGLTRNLPKAVLEPIVIEAIRKHRFLRDLAEMRQTESSKYAEREGSVGPAGAAYVRAMIDVHAQQTVLSTLLDVLGYVPEVPAD